MTNLPTNSNKNKVNSSSLPSDLQPLARILNDQISQLDLLSDNNHQQLEQCKSITENLTKTLSKLNNASSTLNIHLESNSSIQSQLVSCLNQFSQDIKVLDLLTKDQSDALSHLNVDLIEFFDGKNKEFRITREHFNEVINKLASINTSLTEIKASLVKLSSEQQTLFTTHSTNTQNSLTTTHSTITQSQNSLNDVVTNSNNMAKSIKTVSTSIAQNHKDYLSSWWFELAAFLFLLFLSIYSARSNHLASQSLTELNNSIKSINAQIQSLNNSLTPEPTPSPSPNKAGKNRSK